MKNKNLGIVVLIISLFIVACGGISSTTTKTNEVTLGDPKGSIAYQFELLKAGDTEKLRDCFTDRIKDRVTNDAVEKGKSQAGKYSLDDLVGSVEIGEYEGKKTAKIKMKNGRTLTTLIETNGKWLADTIWFN